MLSNYFLIISFFLFLYLTISSSLTIDRLVSSDSSNISSLPLLPTRTEKILLSEHLVSFDSNHDTFFNERRGSPIFNNELSTLTFTMNINISLNGSCQNKTVLLKKCASERKQLVKQLRLLNNLNVIDQEYHFYENRQYSVDRLIVNQSLVSKKVVSNQYLSHQRIESSFKTSYLSNNDQAQQKVSVEQESISELRIFKKEIGIQSLMEKLLEEKSLSGKMIAVFGFHFASSTCDDLPILFCACILASATICWLLSKNFKDSRKSTSSYSESVEAHPYGEVVGMPLEIVAPGNGKSNHLNDELAQLMKYNQALQLQLQQMTIEKDSLLGELSGSQQRNAFAEEQLLRLEGNLANTHRILGKETDKTNSPLRKKGSTLAATPQKNVEGIREEVAVITYKQEIEVLRASVADLRTRLAIKTSEAEDYQLRAEERIHELTEGGVQALLTISELRVMCNTSSDNLNTLKESLALSKEESAHKDSLISGIEDRLKVAETKYEESQSAVVVLQEQHLLLLERSQSASENLAHIDEILGQINIRSGDANDPVEGNSTSTVTGSDVSTRCTQVMDSMLEKVNSLRLAVLESGGREQDTKASYTSQLEEIEVLKVSVADLRSRLAVQTSEAEDYQRQAEKHIHELTGEGVQHVQEVDQAMLTISTQKSCISDLSDSLNTLKESLALSQEESAQLLTHKDYLISGIKAAEAKCEESQSAVVVLQEQHLLLLERSKAASEDLAHINEILGQIDIRSGDENGEFIAVKQLQIAAANSTPGSDVSTRCSQVVNAMLEKVTSLRLAVLESGGREQDMKASYTSQLEEIEVLKVSVADLRSRLAVQISAVNDYQLRLEVLNNENIRLTGEGVQHIRELEQAMLTISTQESCISDLRVMCNTSSDRLSTLKESLALSKEESAHKDSLISGIEDRLKVVETKYEESQSAVVILQEQHLLLLERSKAASENLAHINEILGQINIHSGDENDPVEGNSTSTFTGSDVSTRCSQVMDSMLEKVNSLQLEVLESGGREQDMKASFTSQLVTANQAIEALEQKLHFLKDSHLIELRDYEGKLQRLVELSRNKDASHEALQVSHDQLIEQVQRLQEQIAVLSAEKTAHDQHQISLEEDARVLERDFKESLKRITDLERMNQDLFTAANLKKGSSQRLFELQNEHQKCRVILSEREYSLRTTAKELQVAQAKLIDQTTKLKEVSDRNISLEATLNDVEVELKTLLATEKGVLHQRLALRSKQLTETHTALESLKKDIQTNSDTFGNIEEQCKSLQKQTESIKMSLNQHFEAHIDSLQSFVEIHDPSFDVSILTPQKVVEEKRVAALVASFAKSNLSPHSTSMSWMDAGSHTVNETQKKSSDVIMETISALQVELSKIRSLTTVLQKYIDFVELYTEKK